MEAEVRAADRSADAVFYRAPRGRHGDKRHWMITLSSLAASGACRIHPHTSAASLCADLNIHHTHSELHREALFVDVGAARAYQTQVGRAYGHPVLAFECRSDEVARLQTAFARDGNITLRPVCLGEQPAQAVLHRAEDSSSLHVEMVSHGLESKKARRETMRTETVNISTLDLELSEARLHALGVTRVGYIKIDTQGHEAAVLSGAVATLHRDRPFLFYENMFPLRGSATKPKCQDVLPRASNVSYSCYQVGNDCLCHASPQRGAQLNATTHAPGQRPHEPHR